MTSSISDNKKEATMPDEHRNEYTITLTLQITVYAEEAPELTRFADELAKTIDAKIAAVDSVEIIGAAISGG